MKQLFDLRKAQIPQPSEKTLLKISESLVASKVALHSLTEIKHTKYYRHNLKVKLKQVITELEKVEAKEVQFVIDEEDDIFHHFCEVKEDLFKAIAKLGVQNYDNILKILIAYSISPERIQGIVNKIIEDDNDNEQQE